MKRKRSIKKKTSVKKKPALSLIKGSFKISMDYATWLVYAFLRQTALNKIATEEAIGGTVSASVFRKGPEKSTKYGRTGWFCRNTSNPNYPKFFLAFENGEYELGNVPNTPKSQNLVYS